jgi:hypothetical protein
MREIPAAGAYPAKINGQIVIYKSRTGSLCAAIPVALVDSNPPWSGKYTSVLATADETLQGRNINTLKAIFGWNGEDPFWLMDQDFSNVQFEVVGVHEDYTPEGGETRAVFKIQYLNAPGGAKALPEAADRKAILAKYGGKFRAMASTSATPKKETPTASTPAPEEPKPETQTPPSGPPSRKTMRTAAGQPVTATMEEAWDALVAARPNDNQEALGDFWYDTIKKLFGTESNDLTIQQWGQLKVHFEN